MFNTILFDFNGLIVDDEPIHLECFQKVLLEEEIHLTEKDYWEIYLGFDDKGLFQAIFEKNWKKPGPKKLKELVAKKNSLYQPTIEKKMKLFPGVVDFINKVWATHVLGIVSGALYSEIEFVLKKAGVFEKFETIVSADNTKHGKPNPEGYLLALTHLKKNHPEIIPQTCLVLEDSLAGIESAHRAGMKVCALSHTYPRQELQSADFVKDKFAEIGPLLV
ncbi:MAG TPA: HAD family phosphatase [Deltaproteobacteria bacterium]|nr:MAG: hypothetical protein A2048_00350 [Deltaproteobacteria bacterium GWA2_45_12]HBF11837.1 HAD family phosphatase [Deltaproteobacteria bacterium]